MAETLAQILTQAGLSNQTLAGQTAVVTGAGSGIGYQVARALAWLGARVVIAELDPRSGNQAEADIRAEGGQALFVQTDVSDVDSIATLLVQVHEKFGPVDVLINNAIYICEATVAEMGLEQWERTMSVNLRGTFLASQAFLPDMLAKKRGTIVNLVSAEAMPGLSAYIASKQGIVGFSQSLALEVGEQGVRVIPFGPGMVDTPGIRSVAAGLAPLLGMSEVQFLSIPLHPAFDGLMPPEYAGAAAAYLVAVLADEFQGEMVTGYEVLERAGVIESPGTVKQIRVESETEPAVGVVNMSEIQSMCEQFVEMIAQTEAEFNQLPAFVRPLARSGFKGKSGQSLQDWKRMAGRLADLFVSKSALSDEFPRLDDLLKRLVEYYRGVPAETARFTRDAEMLEQVQCLTDERIAFVQNLRAALADLAG
jgi:NAD(P)-dependent dehydrogenase (short-subunit alcohol dehydrogenase family)